MASSFGRVYRKADIIRTEDGIEKTVYFSDGSKFMYFPHRINPNLHFVSGTYSECKRGKRHREGIADFTEAGEFISMQVWC